MLTWTTALVSRAVSIYFAFDRKDVIARNARMQAQRLSHVHTVITLECWYLLQVPSSSWRNMLNILTVSRSDNTIRMMR